MKHLAHRSLIAQPIPLSQHGRLIVGPPNNALKYFIFGMLKISFLLKMTELFFETRPYFYMFMLLIENDRFFAYDNIR